MLSFPRRYGYNMVGIAKNIAVIASDDRLALKKVNIERQEIYNVENKEYKIKYNS